MMAQSSLQGSVVPQTETGLANEAAANDGLTRLFELHRAELVRFLRARCGDAADAEDLMQELWLKLAGTTTGPIANGRAYLFRMANNLVLDQLRTRRRAMARDRVWIDASGPTAENIEDQPDPALPADEMLMREQEAALLHRAIATLPPGAQRALRLHRIDGLGQAEVARIMGISRSGVEKHLAVAARHLRAALADCGLLPIAASGPQGARRGGQPSTESRP